MNVYIDNIFNLFKVTTDQSATGYSICVAACNIHVQKTRAGFMDSCSIQKQTSNVPYIVLCSYIQAWFSHISGKWPWASPAGEADISFLRLQ